MGESKTTESLYEPLLIPRIPAKVQTAPPELTLTSEHQAQYDLILEHFTKEDYVLPKVENGQLRDEEKFWLSFECIHRYMRATKWAGAKAAIKRLEETLIWRREFGLYDLLTPEHVEPEAVTGKMVIFGYDVDGRPALYLRPSKQNTEESVRQMHFLTWMLERTVDLMGPGIENLALMVDFADRAKNPSIAQSRATVNILQNHYPERLGRALIINVPFLVNAFFKVITPFLDPVTREKMRFNPSCVREGLFSSDSLMREWGGDCAFEYKHELYWPALVRMCSERREALMQEWRKQGAKVGLREWDIKCALDTDVQEKSNSTYEIPKEADIPADRVEVGESVAVEA
ncbi:CRAL/TRIO domain-containing protein [Wolfiporia cocos MD-104 SS10]|uniref:CRAL/TRIO domain-containing protein n=1 Tax=Wolfiporia cocos (strain MD-104) TaxID=742152 RepID=A0A2H3JJ75_WOLCO|nr:CRAL/TRIO domain-containing protein [Wolfiporia cocos MD-104 SS10]